MPPKKKSSQVTEIESSVDNNGSMATSSSTLQEFFDQKMKQQSEYINDLFIKYTKVTKSDMDEVKKSQNFLNDKFESWLKSVKELKDDSKLLRSENTGLQQHVKALEAKTSLAESDMENLKQYLRRDMLEIHGIPVTSGENTNSLVKKVVNLIEPDLELADQEISTSHRLPAAEGHIPPIIVKFTRRDTRNRIYSQKRNLSSKKASDIGFQQQSRIYLNESLTQKSRMLLKKVKEFKINHHYKFLWTRQGKVFLKKNESQSQIASSTSMEEFEAFEAEYNRNHEG